MEQLKPNYALLPHEALIEFKKIFKDEFGIELTDEEATEKAIAVLNIVKVFQKKPIEEEGEKDIK